MKTSDLKRYWPWIWRLGLFIDALLPFTLYNDWLYYVAGVMSLALWLSWPEPSEKETNAKGHRWNRNDALWSAGISLVGVVVCMGTGNVRLSYAWWCFSACASYARCLPTFAALTARSMTSFPTMPVRTNDAGKR